MNLVLLGAPEERRLLRSILLDEGEFFLVVPLMGSI